MKNTAKKVGFSVFAIIWVGQVISLTGSRLTSFALGVWVYQNTGSATQYALISIFAMLPLILISPIAGFFVDRQDRRWIMIASDLGSGLTTAALALAITTSHLSVWHIYLATGFNSIFTAFQWPAYIASIPHLVSKQHLGRANGMIELAEAVAYLLSPVLAGVLLIIVQLQGIILIDFVTFLFALTTLLSVRFFPINTVKTSDTANRHSLLKNLLDSWSYLTSHPGLISLVLFFAGSNFLMGVVTILVPPLLLSLTSPDVMGTVVSIIYLGIVAGSLVMSTWGGWQQKMMTIFSFMLLTGLAMIAAGLRSSIPLFTLAGFAIAYSMPIIRGSSQAIFHKKILPELHGRVFALNKAVSNAFMLIAYIFAGSLVDRVFEPLMATNGALAGTIGRVIGVGPGRGIGLLFVVMGILTVLLTISAYQYRPLRRLEKELPDAGQRDPAVKQRGFL